MISGRLYIVKATSSKAHRCKGKYKDIMKAYEQIIREKQAILGEQTRNLF